MLIRHTVCSLPVFPFRNIAVFGFRSICISFPAPPYTHSEQGTQLTVRPAVALISSEQSVPDGASSADRKWFNAASHCKSISSAVIVHHCFARFGDAPNRLAESARIRIQHRYAPPFVASSATSFNTRIPMH